MFKFSCNLVKTKDLITNKDLVTNKIDAIILKKRSYNKIL